MGRNERRKGVSTRNYRSNDMHCYYPRYICSHCLTSHDHGVHNASDENDEALQKHVDDGDYHHSVLGGVFIVGEPAAESDD